MTRDEAITLLQVESSRRRLASLESSLPMADLVDDLFALGLLKLDEPKSGEARLASALGWPEGGRSQGELEIALKSAGLKLLEA